jgi:hypothetical protein
LYLGNLLLYERRARTKEPAVIGLYIMLGGMALVAVLVTIIDGIEYRRKHRGAK